MGVPSRATWKNLIKCWCVQYTVMLSLGVCVCGCVCVWVDCAPVPLRHTIIQDSAISLFLAILAGGVSRGLLLAAAMASSVTPFRDRVVSGIKW